MVGKRLLVLLLLASLLGAAFAWRQLAGGDERQIQSLVREIARDAERRDVASMAPEVSPSYRDGRGFGRAELFSSLGSYLRHARFQRVLPVKVTVTEINGAEAKATAKILLAQGEGGAGRRVSDAIRIDLDLAREGGRWRVKNAEDWEVPTGDLVLIP